MTKDKFLLPVYKRIGPIFVKGRGSFLWDRSNRRYLDLFPGWGVGILGHTHPKIARVIEKQAKELIFLPNNLYHKWQSSLAEEIVKDCFGAKVFFANSGAEAVEGAIKFSRLYGRGGRHEIITMRDSFHGRTFGAVSATGQKKYKEAFKPLLVGFKEAIFNDFNDFKRNFNKKTIGVLLELIQGEGGVNVADKQYVKDLREFCKRHDLLFIVDEVQTGMGRTGEMFCYQHYGVTPDIMVLSKGLGAGFPISCMIVKESIADIMGAGLHASTFGGNPLATRVALEVFKVIKEEKVLLNVEKMGKYLFDRLKSFRKKFKIIKEIRGKGLMVGIELKTQASPFFEEAFKRRLIVNSTHQNVLRIMPALNVGEKELSTGLDVLDEVFNKLK